MDAAFIYTSKVLLLLLLQLAAVGFHRSGGWTVRSLHICEQYARRRNITGNVPEQIAAFQGWKNLIPLSANRRPLWIYRRLVWPIIEVYVKQIWCNDSIFFSPPALQIWIILHLPHEHERESSLDFWRRPPSGRRQKVEATVGKKSLSWPHLHKSHT